jgi:hypothetical protein
LHIIELLLRLINDFIEDADKSKLTFKRVDFELIIFLHYIVKIIVLNNGQVYKI